MVVSINRGPLFYPQNSISLKKTDPKKGNRHKPLDITMFQFMFHILFHLILHSSSNIPIDIPYIPYIVYISLYPEGTAPLINSLIIFIIYLYIALTTIPIIHCQFVGAGPYMSQCNPQACLARLATCTSG